MRPTGALPTAASCACTATRRRRSSRCWTARCSLSTRGATRGAAERHTRALGGERLVPRHRQRADRAAPPAEMLSFEGREHEFLLALAALEPTASAAPCELPLRPHEPPLYLSAAAPPLAAAAVASFVHSALDPRGRRILALGRGGGVVGLALARLGARHVCVAAADAAEVARIADDARQSLPPAVQVACGSVSVVALDRPRALAGRDFDWVVALDADGTHSRVASAPSSSDSRRRAAQGSALYSALAAAAAVGGRTLAAGGDYAARRGGGRLLVRAARPPGRRRRRPLRAGPRRVRPAAHAAAPRGDLAVVRRRAQVAAGAATRCYSRAPASPSRLARTRAGSSARRPQPARAVPHRRARRRACARGVRQQFSLVGHGGRGVERRLLRDGSARPAVRGGVGRDAGPRRRLAVARCVAGGDGRALRAPTGRCSPGATARRRARPRRRRGGAAAARRRRPRRRRRARLRVRRGGDLAAADGRVWSWGAAPTAASATATSATGGCRRRRRARRGGGRRQRRRRARGAARGGRRRLHVRRRRRRPARRRPRASLVPRRVDGVADAAEVAAGAAHGCPAPAAASRRGAAAPAASWPPATRRRSSRRGARSRGGGESSSARSGVGAWANE